MTPLGAGVLARTAATPDEEHSLFTARFIQMYQRLFVNGFDRHGLQRIRDGKTWYRNNIPGGIGPREVLATLTGARTYAGYSVDREGMSKWTMFDLDLPKPLRSEIERVADPVFKARQEEYAWSVIYEMGRLLKNAIQQNLDVAPVTLHSGSKGLHLYVLWNRPVPVRRAADVGLLMKHLLDVEYRDQGFEFRDVESYPCEADVGAIESDRLPHLVKLPLATHLKTGRIAGFMNLRTKKDLPHDVLWQIQSARVDDLHTFLEGYEEELLEARVHLGGVRSSTRTDRHPDYERYSRLSLPNGPRLLLDRCEALAGLVREARERHHLEHRKRFHLACSLLGFAGGEGEKAVHEILSSCSDYSFEYTQGQLNHALLRDYKPPTCRTLQNEGICPYAGSRCKAVGSYRTPLGCVRPEASKDHPASRQRLRATTQTSAAIPTSTIEQIRADIPVQIDRYLADPEGKLLLFRIDPGVGKTVTVGHHLSNLGLGDKPFRVFWAGQRHDMFSEVAPLFFDIRQILPKISDAIDPATKEPLQRCVNDELRPLLTLMRDKGWAQQETKKVCSRCPLFPSRSCPYFSQWQYPGSFYAPQQHLVTDRLQENKLGMQAILIDEAPFHVFQQELTITPGKIETMIAFLEKQRFKRADKVIRLLNGLLSCMALTRTSTQGHRFLKDLNDVLTGARYSGQQEEIFTDEDAATALDPTLHTLLREIDRSRFWIDWKSFLDVATPLEYPHRWLEALFEGIEKEKLLFGTDYTSRFFLRVEKRERNTTLRELVITELRDFADKSTPLIILDGTPDIAAYKRVFDREIVLYEGHVALQNRVVQLKTGEYTKSTLLGGGAKNRATRDRLLAIVQAIIRRGSSTLVVSTKEMIEAHVGPYLESHSPPGRYRLAYYWGFRGSNEFESCDQVVLLGTANPNFAELTQQESGGHLHEAFLDPARDAIWLPYEGHNLEVSVSGYADERMNHALLFRRNHEMGQMIHRIRPLQHPDKTIWILSCIPIPGIPPTQLVTVEELAGQLGLINESPRDKGMLGPLLQVAQVLLDDPGWFSRKSLAEASQVATRTVTKHIPQVQQLLELQQIGQTYVRPTGKNQPSMAKPSSVNAENSKD